MNFIDTILGRKKSEHIDEPVVAKGVAHINWMVCSRLTRSMCQDSGYVSVDILRESDTRYYVKFDDKELENAWISKSCVELERNDAE
ncbi:MAG: hypothetical protein KAJ03_10255 [Gammaproteobacteria bacterium]|nr:hypothetical protein [Gammaproteobacteria bacterium]